MAFTEYNAEKRSVEVDLDSHRVLFATNMDSLNMGNFGPLDGQTSQVRTLAIILSVFLDCSLGMRLADFAALTNFTIKFWICRFLFLKISFRIDFLADN